MTDATELLSGLEERHVDHRGARLRLFAGGEGPPLLLIHGYGGAAWNFSELAPLLPGRSLLIPDLPGHAGSSPLPAAPGLAAFADAVAACLDGTPVDVFGHSMGGAVALRLAERRPELVRRLVLAAPAGISSSTRGAGLTISLAGIVQPGRIAGRRAGRIARSPRLRRLVFGAFEVANPDLLTERVGARAAARADAAHRRARRRQGAERRRPAPRPGSRDGAAFCCCGAPTIARYRSRTPSNTPAGCALPCA